MADTIDICRLCGAEADYLWDGSVLDIQAVRYFLCPDCGYVQTEYPSWLERAYTEVINDSDTGIIARNITNANIVLASLLSIGQLEGMVVDYAGGYGILVRLLRDYGVDAEWSDRYCQNLLARGFEYKVGSAALVTAFEAFEHFLDPLEELDRMLKIAPNVLCSTLIIADPPPRQEDWWYYGKEHGQHIGFFQLKTLQYLAEQRGKHLVSDGTSCHLISDKPVNPFVWRSFLKVKRYLPQLVRLKLTSKTWQDHLSLSKQSK
jgi:hypothetical protein